MRCKCGNTLSLGTELLKKQCWLCDDGVTLELVTETVERLVKTWGSRPIKQAQSRTVVKRGSSKGESVTKQESKQITNAGNLTEEKVTLQPDNEVTLQDEVTLQGNLTKQQRWKLKNTERVREKEREGQRRRRG